MDEGLLEQMYGDIDHSHSPIAHDDDSVDIYSGLDNTPRKTENAEKCCALSPPGRLRDSMDLYEEIIKEEQQEKEATCNELKTKLDTAQSQVKELLHKLQQSQMQNTSLHTQNICLKKNICALIKTARLEIVRKDEEISRLMQRSGRGGSSYPRSQMNIQRNPNARQNSGANHEPIGCPQTQRPREITGRKSQCSEGRARQDHSTSVPSKENKVSGRESDPVKERHDRPLAPVQTEVAVKDGVEPEIPVERGAVKKPRLSWGGKEQDSSQPEDAGEEGQEDSSLFNLGEEYCVIDEVESSREMDEVFEVPAAASSGIGGAEKALGPLPEPDFKNTKTEHAPDKGEECQSTPLTVLPEAVLQDASTSVVMDTHPKGATTSEVCDVSTNAVSSTVSVEVASQSCDYADVASDVMETVVISSTEPEKDDDEPVTSHDRSKAQSVEVVSSTIRGESIQPEPGSSGSVQMAQDCCSSEPDSTEDEERNAEPSSSVPCTHDEDSMMLTLQNIRHIPEAISPLTSPVRPVKKSLPHCSGKAQHVKSLAKDFSAVTGAKRIDVNKENEKPHCSSTEISQRDSAQTPSSSSSSSENDNELEEGEIVSESEEDPPPVAPSPPLRKTHSTTTIKKQPSPRSPRLAKKQAQKTLVVPQGLSGSRRKTTPNNSPTSNKRQKTVLQFVPKTNPSTVPEVMDMLKSIRTELRRKYMRLQKSFPKKSFYNIIDICLFSFTDFVNNVSFSECCSLESILKPKLNNIISTTMKKISNNGIVNRIFEQQSPSLKKKLWTFVEDQFDFLFREIQATFASLGKSPESRAKHLSMTKNTLERSKEKKELRKIPAKPPAIAVPTPKRKAEEVDSVDMTGVKGKKANPPTVPHRTGLGSRGKNLRMNKEGEDQPSEARELPPLRSPSKAAVTPSKNSSGEKPAACVRRLSHNGSIQDKSDFEILTEQQASSLTFNLVTDSQMGEIFKCLLQGSDLLENSVSVGDAHSWPVGTPRKDAAGWESYVVVTTPNKTATSPSKVITTWSAVSPCKFLSPNSKIRVPLNPALLDESCLLEVPSSSLPLCRAAPSSAVPSQRTYSILAEDLAVSLSIPSPLKSDSHLSFLHPESGEPMSAPESVISAHFSEDALMDGEDATEQDIHLALDSDNSSAGSNGCRSWEEVASPVFQFKPHLPMQAVVMEKSNDHFIVKIRHTSSSFATSPGQNSTAAETGSERVMEHVDAAHSSSGASPDGDRSGQSPNPAFCDDSGTHLPVREAPQASEGGTLEQAANLHDASGAHSDGEPAKAPSNSETGESAALSEELVAVAGESTAAEKDIRIGKKRKKHHTEPRAKRAKTEHAQERLSKQRRKKRSKCAKDKGVRTPKRKRSKSTGPPLSPNSLSAKNIIRKKGEVVVTWTRDEDRYILVELKTKGASPETFSALSAKINKPPDLIGKRFCQLMKLFKKTERMES
ncbi:hypothetical protein AAFF_G00218160 [Aldrovandia affinis]|uniref:CASP8-associated protein 2 n=1 Tax=Aldrovandia affinis TaxID=143900 RepID=A0AAD7SVW3_9TELE|nr:hypothetical protein AAFF_G00218160 [Aldrovandia affinis]